MKISWATSPEIDSEYLEIEVNKDLGLLVIQNSARDEPKVVFCSLFPEPDRVFFEGLDRKEKGINLSAVKALIAEIETALKERPFKS